jgi:predicted nucleic acid-binding protein
MRLVIDCSVAASWYLPDEANDYTESILDYVANNGAWVPSLWYVELMNVLLMAEKRKRVRNEDIDSSLIEIIKLPLHVDNTNNSDWMQRIALLSRQHMLTAYDATYLELAIRKSSPLATQDRQLIKAAKSSGIAVA